MTLFRVVVDPTYADLQWVQIFGKKSGENYLPLNFKYRLNSVFVWYLKNQFRGRIGEMIDFSKKNAKIRLRFIFLVCKNTRNHRRLTICTSLDYRRETILEKKRTKKFPLLFLKVR